MKQEMNPEEDKWARRRRWDWGGRRPASVELEDIKAEALFFFSLRLWGGEASSRHEVTSETLLNPLK